MPFSCHDIKREYETLKGLKDEFVSACEKVGDPKLFSADQLRTLQIQKQKLETARDALKEKINPVIHVNDAINPYREALLASGIENIDTNSIAVERGPITINLRETIKKQQKIYKSMALGKWAENIKTLNLSRLTPEKRRIIEQEVKDGAIPIIMPGRDIQLSTSVDQFETAFKPTWIMNGEKQEVTDAYLVWGHFNNLIENMSVIPEPESGKESDVPDHPYISLLYPTQKPDSRTTDATVNQQQEEFKIINTERVEAHRHPAHVLTPHEYGALQTIATRMAREAMPEQPTTLTPIDSNTWSRFINLPLFSSMSSVDVPSACFDPNSAKATFAMGLANHARVGSGFRLVVRIGL